MPEINFDEWAELYKTDPEEFEARRQKAIDELINNAPVRHRNSMRLTQLECDAYRVSMSPIEATAEMLKSANQKLSQINIHLTELKKIIDGSESQIS